MKESMIKLLLTYLPRPVVVALCTIASLACFVGAIALAGFVRSKLGIVYSNPEVWFAAAFLDLVILTIGSIIVLGVYFAIDEKLPPSRKGKDDNYKM
jgi:hypothetical protein